MIKTVTEGTYCIQDVVFLWKSFVHCVSVDSSLILNSDSLLISTSDGKGRLMYRKLVMEWLS